MMKIKYLIIVYTLVIFNQMAFAQLDANSLKLSMPTGKSINETRIDNVKGDPNLFKEWAKGSVILVGENVSYPNLDLIYDQVKDKLYFKSGNEKLEFTKPVKEFKITSNNVSNIYRAGFPPIDKNTENTLYQVLTDGRIKLLKQVKKDIITTKGYNEVTEMRYDSKVKYFVLDGASFYEIKPNKKGILAAISEKGLNASDQLKVNPPLKNEADLIAFFGML
ncbi:hypothetical protein EA772_05395 [Pedobacter sp. G11]|uniref:hypothetical protein n=1 Tax=Pedobacter sp. G11 TaxID=2482728 RepID=UPI000F5F8422|nr:hypothetical protein [Pedobacter sp. G11]AZI24807.1 hypothetical protein EA772_05395 [Pedobacter sp. G11]